MKNFEGNIYNLLLQNNTVEAQPQLIAEFNYNRYVDVTASNTPSEYEYGYDVDNFPIESIVAPNRPGRGVIRAVVDQSLLLPRSDLPRNRRYYTVSSQDKYKYWVPPAPSDLPYGAFPKVDNQSIFSPQVVYSEPVKTNKLVLGFENSRAFPTDYDIYVLIDEDWQYIGNEVNLWPFSSEADGRLILYYNGSEWTTDVNRDHQQSISGVKVIVNNTGLQGPFLGMIEISARLESDFTKHLKNVSDTFDVGDTTSIMPVGSASSNVASITLDNPPIDVKDISKGLLFNKNNPLSLYHNLTCSNVKFTLGYIYNTIEVGGVEEDYVQQFVMYAEDDWNGAGREDVDISVRDSSKFLQELKPPKMLLENVNAVKAVWKVLDSVGFLDYEIEIGQPKDAPLIPFFWTDGSQTAWEVLQELSEGTQLALVFNERDKLQIKTRSAIYRKTASPVWKLRGEDDEDALSDILETPEPETAHKANSVTLMYSVADIEKNGYGDFLKSQVWEAEPTIIGSSDLSADFTTSSTIMNLNGEDLATWPFSGYIQMEGEFMKYEGKEYGYWPETSPGAKVFKFFTTQEEYVDAENNRLPSKRSDSGFTGRVKIIERGLFNTQSINHYVSRYGDYVMTRSSKSYPHSQNVDGLYKRYAPHKPPKPVIYKGQLIPTGKGYVTLAASGGYNAAEWLLMKAGSQYDVPAKYYGTRIRLEPGGGTDQWAGIYMFGSGSMDSGYYVEIRKSSSVTDLAKELRVYRKTSAGVTLGVGSLVGYEVPIVEGRWYDLDVNCYRRTDNTDRIFVFLDGQMIMTDIISSTDHVPYGGNFGPFTRASTTASFEYLYAVNGDAFANDMPSLNFFDIYTRGYTTKALQKIYLLGQYSYNKYKTGKMAVSGNYRKYDFFDEFGPIAHEVQFMEADFESETATKSPELIITNQNGVSYFNLESTPFDASFYAVNTSRDNEPVEGTVEDVDFKAVILAYKVRLSDPKPILSEDEKSIREFGKLELEVSNRWIQTKDGAENAAEWIRQHWEAATSVWSLTVFGNPLIQVGDVVQFVYKLGNMTAEDKFFVISSSTSFDSGMSTTLKLRLA